MASSAYHDCLVASGFRYLESFTANEYEPFDPELDGEETFPLRGSYAENEACMQLLSQVFSKKLGNYVIKLPFAEETLYLNIPMLFQKNRDTVEVFFKNAFIIVLKQNY